MQKAKLVLEDGTEFHGYAFGADAAMAGEVVFNTGKVAPLLSAVSLLSPLSSLCCLLSFLCCLLQLILCD
jgi:hypothetical protein